MACISSSKAAHEASVQAVGMCFGRIAATTDIIDNVGTDT